MNINRVDDYWQPLDDELDHPPCDCLKAAERRDTMALATLEAAEQERQGTVPVRLAAAVDRDAAEKRLADARHFSRNAAKLLAWSLLGFVADAVLFVAAMIVFCKAGGVL